MHVFTGYTLPLCIIMRTSPEIKLKPSQVDIDTAFNFQNIKKGGHIVRKLPVKATFSKFFLLMKNVIYIIIIYT